ncbi:MAG: hypothetical protein K9L68_09940 [Spirochaetales bacterium]|nr:hypothetical protein [Spirochaetales bacterium]MCF7938903.1 hypothetical protein [Spirochaetales bacterium]
MFSSKLFSGKKYIPAAGALVIASLFLISGCALEPGGQGSAAPVINAKGFETTLESVRLEVSAPEFGRKVFNLGSKSATFFAPAGPDRLFEAYAFIDPDAVSPVQVLYGSALADLPAGKTTQVEIGMGAYATKFLVPDYSNNRIVQLGSLGSIDWKEFTAGASPQRVRVSGSGEIWYSISGGDYDLYARDNIEDTTADAVFAHEGIPAFTFMESEQLFIYVTDTAPDSIHYIQMPFSTPATNTDSTEITLSGGFYPNYSGVAAMNRSIFLANNGEFQGIMKVDPTASSGSRLKGTYSLSNTVVDIEAVNGFIYVLENRYAPETSTLHKFDENLNPVGTLTGPSAQPFRYFKKFIPQTGNRVTFIESDSDGTEYRVFSINSEDFTDRTVKTFGGGSGTGQFNL